MKHNSEQTRLWLLDLQVKREIKLTEYTVKN